jgi:hypothetical protein
MSVSVPAIQKGTVKLADLRDNLYRAEIAGLDKAHREKYRRAIELIKRDPPAGSGQQSIA